MEGGMARQAALGLNIQQSQDRPHCQVSGSGVEIYVGTVVVWRAYAHGRIWARRLRRNLCVSVNKI